MMMKYFKAFPHLQNVGLSKMILLGGGLSKVIMIDCKHFETRIKDVIEKEATGRMNSRDEFIAAS